MNDVLEPGTLLAQLLRIFRIIPDLVICELQLYFSESFLSVFIVKDTP